MRSPCAQSVDIVIFNHIYEHVVDADAVMADIRRVLRPDGVVYLGLGNRLGIMEPHYKLPFLSWLPKRIAHRYVRSTGRASNYYETFRTRRGLRKMCAGLRIWDYLRSASRLTRIRGRRYGAGATFLCSSNNLASGRACRTHVYLGRDTRSASTGRTGGQGFTVADCDRLTHALQPNESWTPRAPSRQRRARVPLPSDIRVREAVERPTTDHIAAFRPNSRGSGNRPAPPADNHGVSSPGRKDGSRHQASNC